MIRKASVASIGAAVALFASGSLLTAPAHAKGPTCGGLGGIAVHAQHIIGDYITGLGGIGGGITWPPKNGVVGAAVSANGGPAVRGGPGPGFHFPNGFAPGASFCNINSKSPGLHLDLP